MMCCRLHQPHQGYARPSYKVTSHSCPRLQTRPTDIPPKWTSSYGIVEVTGTPMPKCMLVQSHIVCITLPRYHLPLNGWVSNRDMRTALQLNELKEGIKLDWDHFVHHCQSRLSFFLAPNSQTRSRPGLKVGYVRPAPDAPPCSASRLHFRRPIR